MIVTFPSREFDDAVAAVCHGLTSGEQMRALNELLRSSPPARDEYLLRVELHSRLASEPDLFASAAAEVVDAPSPDFASKASRNMIPLPTPRRQIRIMAWAAALAACLALVTAVGWVIWTQRSGARNATSMAVAMLARAVGAQWKIAGESRPVGAALEPGWLRLKAGLAQVVFYNGARLVIEGPAEVQLISSHEAFCSSGLVSVEVPPQARGFRVGTPQMTVVDLGTAFGIDVKNTCAEVHVFKGQVEYQAKAAPDHSLQEGEAASVDATGAVRYIPINPSAFEKAFDLQRDYLAMQERRYQQWRDASARLNNDRSLLVHFDFENTTPADWTLCNAATYRASVPTATIVGCQWTEGRWPGKRALEFRSISDRVRLRVPGEYQALTLSAWVSVKGLDRPFNSLLMSDGFDPGEIHWQVRNDGVLDLGVKGPGAKDCQISVSPTVVGLDRFGLWMHLAVVVDGKRKRVIHYVDGTAVSHDTLKIEPPFRLGECELGNWNVSAFPKVPPFLIRHFSGSIDEFALFTRALSDTEIRQLYTEGKPQPEPERVVASHGLKNESISNVWLQF
jgi:hypothetical protein